MPSNPFSTRFIRPGAIPFVFPEGQSAAALVERLREHNWWGQIIGDHGSGKSTLLATLAPALEAAGRQLHSIALHQGEHKLPLLDRSSLTPTSLLIIDGYEQLSWWSRRRVKSLCRRYGASLLITAHSNMGLPTLFQTQPSQQLAQTLVEKIVPPDSTRVTSDDINRAFAATGGNLRETLFQLYDVYQQRNG